MYAQANAVQASLGYLVYVGPLPVCTYDTYDSKSEHWKLTTATRVCSIVSDLLVITVTWWRTYALKREADRLHMRASLATLLLRDGTVYFAAILVLNVVHAVVVFYDGNVDYVSIFLSPIPALLTSRFLLNLRRANDPTDIDVHLGTVSASNASPHTGMLSFALSSAPPDMRTLQFAPAGASVGGGTGTGTFMDMDGALWTGFASSVGDAVESAGTATGEGERAWSPSTESERTKAEAKADIGDGGGEGKDGVGVEEIELTLV